ncbi:hypothetical protein GQ568_01340 [Patescibacteria group bacterium]|nr:hypothetical protein [Patescibacteria group bacterium]
MKLKALNLISAFYAFRYWLYSPVPLAPLSSSVGSTFLSGAFCEAGKFSEIAKGKDAAMLHLYG